MTPMKLVTLEFPFTLLTPCFSGGADGKDGPSMMRVPAIRGQVRDWHRILFGNADANLVWGSASNSDSSASRIALRLTATVPASVRKEPVLPHKFTAGRSALMEDTRYTVEIQRLVGCKGKDWDHARSAMRTWLLAGCLGYRANRAAGSVWPADASAPPDAAAFASELRSIGLRWPIRLSDPPGQVSRRELRKTASDTVMIRQYFGGAGETREPSPIRFKVVSFGGNASLLAIAAPKELSTPSGKQQLLDAGLNALKHKPPWSRLSWIAF